MASVIDTLFLEIGIKDKFSSQAKEVEKALSRIEKLEEKQNKEVKKSAKQNEKLAKEITKQNKKAEDSIKSLSKAYGEFNKILQNVAATVISALGVELVHNVAKANVELDNLSKNIGISRQALQAWQGAAKMTGGSAEGIRASLSSLSSSITRFKVMGDASSLPFFNALGVAPIDYATGKMKDLNKIMIELSSSIQGMEQGTAKMLINGLGIDDGTFNMLMSGPVEVRRLLAEQNKIARVNDKDIENSRKLLRSVGMLQSQFEALRVKITSSLTPVMTKITDLAIKFVDYLSRNEETLKTVISGISLVIATSLVPVLFTAVGAAISLAASLLPTVLAIGTLGVGLALLYDDYNTWAKGGKSLFDWKEFKTWLDDSDFSVRSFAQSILYLLTGYKDWSNFVSNAKDWLKIKGFIDENGSFSIEGLKRGFKRMIADLLDFVMPLFSRLGDIIGAALTLNFDKAGNTQFPILTNTPPKGSKFISKERMSSLKMTPTDYFVSISLIGQDLKTNLKNQGRDNWLLYRMLLSRKLDDFNKYIQNGGSNDDYYLTLFVAKIFSLVENKVISQEALSNSKLGSKSKPPFKEKDIDDLSLDKQSKEKVKKELKIFFE